MQQRLSVDSVAIVEVAKNASLGVFVSFAEIYNEHIYDLLKIQNTKQREKLQLGNFNDRAYIKNLTMVPVSNGLQAYQILQYGLRNLSYAATRINNHSSRSHCIFTIKLVQASTSEEGYNVSYFNFCDLAGSERVKKTLNVGDRLKESNNINTSLMVLGRCITAVRDSQKSKDNRLIPFRESKLTQLFKRALSGLEDISMIVNINPARNMFDESHHVLNFSAIAKDIIIEQPQAVNIKKANRFSNYMQNTRSSYTAIIREMNEDHYIEIERLSKIIVTLETENAHLNQQILEIEQESRNEVINAYKEIIQKKEQSFKRQLEALKKDYENEIAALKKFYTKRENEEIINLDSSSEDSTADSLTEKLRAELAEKEQILQEATIDYQQLKEERNEIQKNYIRVCEELEMYKAIEHYNEDCNSQEEEESEENLPNGKQR